MMNARKCDRCGKLYEEYNVETPPKIEKHFNGFAVLSIGSKGTYHMGKALDICPECKAEFQRWMEGAEMEYKSECANCDRN